MKATMLIFIIFLQFLWMFVGIVFSIPIYFLIILSMLVRADKSIYWIVDAYNQVSNWLDMAEQYYKL